MGLKSLIHNSEIQKSLNIEDFFFLLHLAELPDLK